MWRELIGGWFPEVVDPSLRAVTWPPIAEHHEWISGQLDATVTVATIAQRLRDDRQVDVSESSVRRYVTAHFADRINEKRATPPRPPVPAGEEAQVDYGKLGMWTDPETGKRVSVWAFAIILSCSRWLFVQPVLKMDQTSWCSSHVAAFEFFGGTPQRIVCDNLKTGVSKPDLYDPQINRAYAELASFYGVLIDPARAATPKDKPRIERPMPYIRDSFFKGREFSSLPQMQDAAIGWCTDVYGRHAHRGIDGVPPAELFAQIEQHVLNPLPPRRFELVTYHVGKVAPDCHVKAGPALYSVPWRLIGSHVRVRTCGDMSRCSPATRSWRPMCCAWVGGRPISSTTRPTRWPSPPARWRGAAGRPRKSVSTRSRWSPNSARSTRSIGCAQSNPSSVYARSIPMTASTPPAPGQSPSAMSGHAPSRAS